MRLKDIINIFIELSKPLNISKFKLWWRSFITGEIKIIDYVVKDVSGIYKPMYVKFILLFEKVHTKYLGKNYIFLRHFIIDTDNDDDLKNKLPSVFNAFLRSLTSLNYKGIVVCLSKNSNLIDYFQTILDFKYSESDNIYYQLEFNEPEVIILTRKLTE